jgi:predicted RNA-binding Zn-ribbon protein involved in translation (DUF1610 family)
MALEVPTSMDDLIYFTNRTIMLEEGSGKAKAWVYRKVCPECGKAKMGKPINEKTGKAKIRSTEYICPECGYTEEKSEHEETLTVEIQYTCPYCQHVGEATTPCVRKTWNGVKAYVFECDGCGKKVGVSKKMKAPKAKKKK